MRSRKLFHPSEATSLQEILDAFPETFVDDSDQKMFYSWNASLRLLPPDLLGIVLGHMSSSKLLLMKFTYKSILPILNPQKNLVVIGYSGVPGQALIPTPVCKSDITTELDLCIFSGHVKCVNHQSRQIYMKSEDSESDFVRNRLATMHPNVLNGPLPDFKDDFINELVRITSYLNATRLRILELIFARDAIDTLKTIISRGFTMHIVDIWICIAFAANRCLTYIIGTYQINEMDSPQGFDDFYDPLYDMYTACVVLPPLEKRIMMLNTTLSVLGTCRIDNKVKYTMLLHAPESLHPILLNGYCKENDSTRALMRKPVCFIDTSRGEVVPDGMVQSHWLEHEPENVDLLAHFFWHEKMMMSDVLVEEILAKQSPDRIFSALCSGLRGGVENQILHTTLIPKMMNRLPEDFQISLVKIFCSDEINTSGTCFRLFKLLPSIYANDRKLNWSFQSSFEANRENIRKRLEEIFISNKHE